MSRRKCIWKSLSSGAPRGFSIISPLSHPAPALRIISLRNPAGPVTLGVRTFPSARVPSILHFLGNWCLLLVLACGLAKWWVSSFVGDADAPVKAGRRRVLGIEDESRLMRGVGCPDVLFVGLSIMKLWCGLRFTRRWDSEKASGV